MVDLYLYEERNENGVNTEVVNEDAPVRFTHFLGNPLATIDICGD